jgi:hypothetical protein
VDSGANRGLRAKLMKRPKVSCILVFDLSFLLSVLDVWHAVSSTRLTHVKCKAFVIMASSFMRFPSSELLQDAVYCFRHFGTKL